MSKGRLILEGLREALTVGAREEREAAARACLLEAMERVLEYQERTGTLMSDQDIQALADACSKRSQDILDGVC